MNEEQIRKTQEQLKAVVMDIITMAGGKWLSEGCSDRVVLFGIGMSLDNMLQTAIQNNLYTPEQVGELVLSITTALLTTNKASIDAYLVNQGGSPLPASGLGISEESGDGFLFSAEGNKDKRKLH